MSLNKRKQRLYVSGRWSGLFWYALPMVKSTTEEISVPRILSVLLLILAGAWGVQALKEPASRARLTDLTATTPSWLCLGSG